ncbi:MAG: 1,4-dihydroxy-2-naphthoate octaprenyltransferase [Bacteroidales bacterium]|nr:1,4-dihydroxy-2-naphthoate octaprenyltransferase [Bacteroidales bacterium]
MNTIRPLISSMRLRTLPLSLAGVVCGGVLGYAGGEDTSIAAVVLLCLTACALQVLTNMSNELGDYLSGVDGAQREGPSYSLVGGSLTPEKMRHAIVGVAVVCCLLGLAMVFCAQNTWQIWRNAYSYIIIGLGVAAIWAATHYTLGRHPYGYRGWGDLAVLIFFGWATVAGGYYVVSRTLNPIMLWPASGIGLLSVAVLNVNNIRDMASDRGRRLTVPLRIGERRAKIYQTFLVTVGVALMVVGLLRYAAQHEADIALWRWAFVLTVPLFALHIVGVWKRHGKALDPMLPLLVMSTFGMSILFTLGCYGL